MMTAKVMIALFLFQGCFLVSDEAQNEMENRSSANSVSTTTGQSEESPQIIAEDNVEAYVKNKFGAETAYKIYNFGQLFRLKKNEQKQLDDLKELRALVPSMQENYGSKTDSVLHHYDTLIARKEREIVQKGIKSDYIISHVFTIKKNKASDGTVYEGDFILDDQLKVKDFRIDMAADLAKDDFDWFYYFFQKFPIFHTDNYDHDVDMSNSIYDYYNARLAGLNVNKEEFLLTALRVTRVINKSKKYDKNIIAGFVIMKRLEERNVCDNYKPVVFTPAEEIMVKRADKDSLIGYKVFHKFECTGADGKTQTKAVYAELDPYFVPAGILDVEPPFDKYFEKKDGK